MLPWHDLLVWLEYSIYKYVVIGFQLPVTPTELLITTLVARPLPNIYPGMRAFYLLPGSDIFQARTT